MKNVTCQEKLADRIDFGIRLGAAKAKAAHKKAGHSIAVWQDGKVVRIPPEKIKVPKEFKSLIDK